MRRQPTDRGQSVVIGFILMFSILMLLLVILQTTAVPVWNQEIEFAHNQEVQGEMEGLGNDIAETAAAGRVGSGSITLGARYPTRPFLLNPPPASGTLGTREPQPLTITNATASGETRDYWDGTPRAFTDRHLVYRPDYNEFRSAPTTGYENGVLYNRQEDRSVVLAERGFVNDRRITLVTLNGSLSKSGVRSESVEFQPLSAPQQVTTVRSDPGPLTITLSTTLDEETWTDLLADQRVSEGGYVTGVSVTQGDPYNTLRVTLVENESYDLRMAKVGVGSRQDDPPAHYITTESPASLDVPTGATERVVFEVRDRYNNPVSGVEVQTLPASLGTLQAVDPITDENGHAVFRYDATSEGRETLTAQFGPNPGGLETANVTVEARAVGGGGTQTASLGVEWIAPSIGTDDRLTVESGSTTELTVESQPAVEGLDVSYVVNDSALGRVDPSGTTNASGTNQTTLSVGNVTSNRTVAVYAVGGDDADVMTVTVTPAGATTPGYALDVLEAREVRNDVNVTFDAATTDPNASIRIETLEPDGSVRYSADYALAATQPQSVLHNRRGNKQVERVRVLLLDGNGVAQAEQTVSVPYSSQ